MESKNYRCPVCGNIFLFNLTDLDLPEANRTQANLWKTKFFEMHHEVVKANKGIQRLRRKLDNIKDKAKAGRKGE